MRLPRGQSADVKCPHKLTAAARFAYAEPHSPPLPAPTIRCPGNPPPHTAPEDPTFAAPALCPIPLSNPFPPSTLPCIHHHLFLFLLIGLPDRDLRRRLLSGFVRGGVFGWLGLSVHLRCGGSENQHVQMFRAHGTNHTDKTSCEVTPTPPLTNIA